MRAHQRIGIIKLGAAQQIKAALIDQNPGAALFDHQIILGRRGGFEIEFILKAAATAGQHGHAERRRRRLCAEDLGNAGRSPLGQAEVRRMRAHAVDILRCRSGLKGHVTSMELAPYAVRGETSRGRLTPEPASAMRSPFQRDRDRVIHCTAFRKLQYKTQVFVNHEGDFYRTRLTHSLEVAQIARSIARALRLDDDLTEALALAHDLGHPPFGHAGETGLNAALAAFGGFDHNAQSLRVVTVLERRYAGFDGLNLTWETLEGLVKHNGPIAEPGGFVAAYDARHPLDLGTFASAEAQVAALADDIAYHSHDLDDGLRAHLFTAEDVAGLPVMGDCLREVRRLHGSLGDSRLRHETIRRVLDRLIRDVVEESTRRLAALAPSSADAIRRAPAPVIAFSTEMAEANRAIKSFLFAHMYRHWRVNRATSKARKLTAALATLLLEEPGLLPDDWGPMAGAPQSLQAAETVRDYIAGMTDRYARDEFRRLTDPGVPG